MKFDETENLEAHYACCDALGGTHAPHCPTALEGKQRYADDLMARRTRRKVETIVESTTKAFRQAAGEYGTLSADELIACGTILLMKLTVAPLEKMAADPAQMRKEVVKMMLAMIEQGGEDIN